MRREFSKKTKDAAWKRANGRCEFVASGDRCQADLRPGNVEYHHVLEAELGGDASLDNCQAVCIAHHKFLTRTQTTPRLTKMRSQRAMARNTKPAPARKIPYRKAAQPTRDKLPMPERRPMFVKENAQ